MSPVPARNPNLGKALSLEEILKIVQERVPEADIASSPNGARWIQVKPSALADCAPLLRDDPRLRFEQLCCLSGVDLQRLPGAGPTDDLCCVYEFHSVTLRHSARLKVRTPRQEPSVPSVESLWGVAGFFEREIYDLLGVDFPGNHDMRRLLLPPDWVGFPLRKDYEYPVAYGGVELKREGQQFESGPYK